jgi:hypothetical protein
VLFLRPQHVSDAWRGYQSTRVIGVFGSEKQICACERRYMFSPDFCMICGICPLEGTGIGRVRGVVHGEDLF